MHNIIVDIDSYKSSHFNQYPPHTTQVSSYIESRGGRYSHVLFFGLQRFISKYLAKPITQADIDYAEELITAHGLPFNRAGWQHILEKHQGYLPLKIEAVPEGTLLPTKNILVQITNTDPEAYWLPSYVETALLRAVWYPTTVATLSYRIKQYLLKALLKTTDLTYDQACQAVEFKLHDFGSRGASSTETSGIGGLAHLVSFKGTDAVLALIEGREYYAEKMAGFSIAASEHSTMTSWGREQEYDAYKNLIDQYLKPGQAVSMVCDSYDMAHALTTMVGRNEFKTQVEQSGGTLVIRPDSGDPAEVVLDTTKRLEEIFGASVNSKGYKVLPSYIRIIQGDGINTLSIERICETLIANGYSVDNVAFGMGAELQQKVNRDTCRFAMKASAVQVDGVWRDAYKSPVGDPGKQSKRGVLKLVQTTPEVLNAYKAHDDAWLAANTDKFVAPATAQTTYATVRADDERFAQLPNQLEVVFENGRLLRQESLAEIRTRANATLDQTVEYFADK